MLRVLCTSIGESAESCVNFNFSDWRKLMDRVIEHLNGMVIGLVEENIVVRAYSVGLSSWCEEGALVVTSRSLNGFVGEFKLQC